MAKIPRKVPAVNPSAPLTEVHITGIDLEQLDEQRVRCIITLSALSKSPDIVIAITDPEGHQLAGITILETPDTINRFVLHLPTTPPPSRITLTAYLKYDEIGIVSKMEKIFSLA